MTLFSTVRKKGSKGMTEKDPTTFEHVRTSIRWSCPQASPSEVQINNTLLELYLADDLHSTAVAKAALSDSGPVPSSLEMEEAEQDRKERLKKALSLLKTGWPTHEPQPKYDPDLAVVLCQMHGFREGRLFLYEKMRLYKEVGKTAGVFCS
jgi:hypothetical protein